jgi:hypothetical protein
MKTDDERIIISIFRQALEDPDLKFADTPMALILNYMPDEVFERIFHRLPHENSFQWIVRVEEEVSTIWTKIR